MRLEGRQPSPYDSRREFLYWMPFASEFWWTSILLGIREVAEKRWLQLTEPTI